LTARGAELNHTTWNDDREIAVQIAEDAPDAVWAVLDDNTYATPRIGESAPCVLSIYDSVEPSLATELLAESILADAYGMTIADLESAIEGA
jgi:hypothetical protein